MDGSATTAYPSLRGGLGVRGDTPAPDGLIDEVTREVRSATSDLHELGASLRDHLDITLGHNPQPSSTNGAKGNESPIRAEQLRQSLGQLRHAITELREQVVRTRAL